ncbi:LPS assembly lipoprotein LptE [Marinobacter sp.]|uniref:LPS-assembly lipoprotein LptE n=1 Tax=Marinobacter sp. TaxID=50741 RepID=UPI002356AADF|nr:LPS assembly lipoprotein LptE [Marinobacter sp.]
MPLRSPPYPALPAVMSAIVMTTIAGCGFQLRGAPPVSAALQPLAVECARDVPELLCESVRDQLELGDVELAEASNAAYVMKLSDFQQDRRASAITVQAAAAEYTLRNSVSLELISTDQVPIIGDTRLSSSESYRYDETNVLAKQREEEELQTQLSNRLAQQIIFRLAPLTQARIDTIRDQHQSDSGDQPDNDAPAP